MGVFFLNTVYYCSYVLVKQVYDSLFLFFSERSCLQLLSLHLCNSSFYARQHNAVARICHANSVCPSVTRVYYIKTAERIVEILSPSDRPIMLVFRHQGSLCKSEGVTLNGGAKYKGVAIFDQCAAISWKR